MSHNLKELAHYKSSSSSISINHKTAKTTQSLINHVLLQNSELAV